MIEVKEIHVEGHRLTIAGEARLDGEPQDYLIDGEDASIVITGASLVEMVSNAFAAGLHAHVVPRQEVDQNVSHSPLPPSFLHAVATCRPLGRRPGDGRSAPR